MGDARVPKELRIVLQSLEEPEKLLGAVLDHALVSAGAVRGLLFDREQMVRAVNYSHNEKIAVWKSLERLLLESDGVLRTSEPFFAWPAKAGGTFSGAPVSGAPVTGVAGVLVGPPGSLAVLAIERDTAFSESQIAAFAEWIEIASMPVALSLSNARLRRLVRRAPLRFRDLPLQELEELPNMQEVEMMLIADAMRRHQNHKGRAAATLGISREGLRRKLLR